MLIIPDRKGELTRSRFLKGAGDSAAARLSLTLDLTNVINAMNFMESVRKAVEKDNPDGKRTHEYMVNYAYTAYAGELLEYSYGQENRMAHVYEWSEVIDESMGTSKSTKNGNAFDRANIFKPTFDRDKPLWRLDPPVEESDTFISRVSFFTNSKPAMYDKRVYSSVTTHGPRRWGEHHFRDQASQLEAVQKIVKRTDRTSKRRVGFARSAAGPGGGIVQLTVSRSGGGLYLQNYQNYSRPNKFYRKFAEFYMAFASRAAAGAQGVVVDSEKDFNRVISTEAQKILQSRTYMVNTGLSGADISTKSGVSVKPGGSAVLIDFTAGGKPIARIPPQKPIHVNEVAGALHRELINKTARIKTRDVKRLTGAPKDAKARGLSYKVGAADGSHNTIKRS